jgi:hypothetical protein
MVFAIDDRRRHLGSEVGRGLGAARPRASYLSLAARGAPLTRGSHLRTGATGEAGRSEGTGSGRLAFALRNEIGIKESATQPLSRPSVSQAQEASGVRGSFDRPLTFGQPQLLQALLHDAHRLAQNLFGREVGKEKAPA